jgi:hypothetical protein
MQSITGPSVTNNFGEPFCSEPCRDKYMAYVAEAGELEEL